MNGLRTAFLAALLFLTTARACPAECWFNPVKLICDMFNRLYFFEDLGPFAVRAGALVLMALLFVAAATLIFGRSRYEHL